MIRDSKKFELKVIYAREYPRYDSFSEYVYGKDNANDRVHRLSEDLWTLLKMGLIADYQIEVTEV